MVFHQVSLDLLMWEVLREEGRASLVAVENISSYQQASFVVEFS